jgi:6-phosphogluconolactonase (cycloisomerase 2 family)
MAAFYAMHLERNPKGSGRQGEKMKLVKLSGAWVAGVLLLCACHDKDAGGSTPQKVAPTITWSQPAAITYGTPLDGTELEAQASVPGSFAYSPAASTVLDAGSQTLTANFTPTDTAHYTSASATVTLTVNKATPTITWVAPAAIAQGTALSATQLDATASVDGTFAYTPALSTVLAAGTQTLSVTFTPTDESNYANATDSVSLTVNAASGIGPAGGTVTGYYGANVTVPAGALSSNVDVEIVYDSSGAPSLPTTGIETAGAMYALTPHGTQFAAPVTVRVPFDSDRLPTDATPVLYKAEVGGSFAPIATTVSGNVLSADVSNFSWVIPGYAATLPRMVYALTTAQVNGNRTIRLSGFKIAKGTGALSAAVNSAPVGNGAISVTVHPSRRFAYVTNGQASTAGEATQVAPNSVSVYLLDPVTGAVSGPVDTKTVNGKPVSVVVHPTGKFIYVVNDVDSGSTLGNISAFSIDATSGALTALGTVADLGGVPATALGFAPSGEFAYVSYSPPDPQSQGNFDTVKTYAVSSTGLFSSSSIGSANSGDYPRALVVTPGGHFVYVASLGSQGSVGQLATYAINQQDATLSLQNSFTISTASGQSPLSLAMDSEARFLYVGLQSPVFAGGTNNYNVHVYQIASTGALSFASGVLTPNNPQGAIALTAEPQSQFLYVVDANAQISAFSIGSTGILSASSTSNGVFNGGATGGVGDPFFFAAGGASPVWQDNCTIIGDFTFSYGGCYAGVIFSAGPGSGGRTGTGLGPGGSNATPPPPTSFSLEVVVNSAGGSVVSSPPGIDIDETNGQDTFLYSFSPGTIVSLHATPPDNLNTYDIKWTGACYGDGPDTSVNLGQDQSCYVTFTPAAQR